MKRMTKAEYDAWRAAHPGGSQYEIFHKKDGKDVSDFSFWAAGREGALEELELFRQKQRLVAPADGAEYFYREINNHVVMQEDGTYLVGSGLHDLMGLDEKPGVIEKAGDFFRRICWRMRDLKYALFDVAFWLGHYDPSSCHGEERGDYWSLDATIARKIKFNVPRMIEAGHGCPSVYVAQAVAEKRRITPQQAAAKTATGEEMDAAVALWNAELEKLLLYVRLYEYYDNHGFADGPGAAELEAEYKKTLPVMPGTDGELDYAKCSALADEYWNKYCDQWKKIGRMCWD